LVAAVDVEIADVMPPPANPPPPLPSPPPAVAVEPDDVEAAALPAP